MNRKDHGFALLADGMNRKADGVGLCADGKDRKADVMGLLAVGMNRKAARKDRNDDGLVLYGSRFIQRP